MAQKITHFSWAFCSSCELAVHQTKFCYSSCSFLLKSWLGGLGAKRWRIRVKMIRIRIRPSRKKPDLKPLFSKEAITRNLWLVNEQFYKFTRLFHYYFEPFKNISGSNLIQYNFSLPFLWSILLFAIIMTVSYLIMQNVCRYTYLTY